MITTRDLTMPAQAASNALINIPVPPVPGQAYRNTNLDAQEISAGDKYKAVFDSAKYNQLQWLSTGLIQMAEQYGIMPYSALTDYPVSGICMGLDGNLYQALLASGPGTSDGPQPTSNQLFWGDLLGVKYWVLKRLKASIYIYVTTTGNDATADGTEDLPFRTVQAAMLYIANNFYLSEYNVFISVAAGTYVEALQAPLYMATLGRIYIVGQGDTTIIRSVERAAPVWTCNVSSSYQINNCQLVVERTTPNPQSYGIFVNAGELTLRNCTITALDSATNLTALICAAGNGIIWLGHYNQSETMKFNLNGGKYQGILYGTSGKINLAANLIISGGANVSVGFCWANNQGGLQREGNVLATISGTVTGPRYYVNSLLSG